MQHTEKEISLIIPVFNSSNCIEEIVNESVNFFVNKKIEYEIVLIDDGSKDESWEIIKNISKINNNVKGFSLSKNFGQHKATLCGFINSTGKYVVTIDDDYEHNPNDIFELYNTIKNNQSDIVYGIPKNKRKSILRRALTNFYKFISKIENPLATHGSSFRIFNRPLVQKITDHQSHLFFIDELVLWYTSNISSCYFNFRESKRKTSSYSYFSLFNLSTKVFMISTTMPLKLVKFIGFSMSSISFLIGAFYFIKKIIHKIQAPGYTSIIVSVLFSAGLILFCLGIIGEYLGNVLMMQNKKPSFYIKDKT